MRLGCIWSWEGRRWVGMLLSYVDRFFLTLPWLTGHTISSKTTPHLPYASIWRFSHTYARGIRVSAESFAKYCFVKDGRARRRIEGGKLMDRLEEQQRIRHSKTAKPHRRGRVSCPSNSFWTPKVLLGKGFPLLCMGPEPSSTSHFDLGK